MAYFSGCHLSLKGRMETHLVNQVKILLHCTLEGKCFFVLSCQTCCFQGNSTDLFFYLYCVITVIIDYSFFFFKWVGLHEQKLCCWNQQHVAYGGAPLSTFITAISVVFAVGKSETFGEVDVCQFFSPLVWFCSKTVCKKQTYIHFHI